MSGSVEPVEQRPTLGSLVIAQAIIGTDVERAVDVFIADQGDGVIRIGRYAFDPGAALRASSFATAMLMSPTTSDASKRIALRMALMLASPIEDEP